MPSNIRGGYKFIVNYMEGLCSKPINTSNFNTENEEDAARNESSGLGAAEEAADETEEETDAVANVQDALSQEEMQALLNHPLYCIAHGAAMANHSSPSHSPSPEDVNANLKILLLYPGLVEELMACMPNLEACPAPVSQAAVTEDPVELMSITIEHHDVVQDNDTTHVVIFGDRWVTFSSV